MNKETKTGTQNCQCVVDEFNRDISRDKIPNQSIWLLQFCIINKNKTIFCKEFDHEELLLHMQDNLLSLS